MKYKQNITIFVLLFLSILIMNSKNGSYDGMNAIAKDVDTIYVIVGDTMNKVFNVAQQKDTIELIIKDERNHKGNNPFLYRQDTSKYALHSIRKITIISECDITDTSIDSVYFNEKYYRSSSLFRIKNDEIVYSNWRDINGGIGFGGLYKKGFHVSSPSRNGGYFIEKRTPDDTVNINRPIGEQIFEYYYDDQGRIVSIKSLLENEDIYEVKYNTFGLWCEIKFKDLKIRRNR